MTTDEMRIAIAGHYFKCFGLDDGSKNLGLIGFSKQCPPAGYKYFTSDEIYCIEIPRLTLDWMHDVEEILEPNIQWLEFLRALGKILHGNFDTLLTARSMSDAHATAPQRAEAFLRVINKWKD